MIRFAKLGVVALALTATSAYAAAPAAVTTAFHSACCALAICCGLPCCDSMAGMAM